MAFVGYGVTAPEFHYDDYAGMDVTGRVVVMLFGAPSQFGSAPSAYYSSFRVKAAIATSHGAVGILTIWAGKIAEHYPFKAVGSDVSNPSLNWLDTDGRPNGTQEKIRASALLSVPGANKIFEGSPKSLEQALADANAGRAQAFALPATITVQTRCDHRDLQSPNVVGVLPGSDPKLKSEYVLFSAHLDHLGIGDAVDGDNIYNGAVDNASGIAALIEIAQAFASSKPPRRSIIFLAVTGEEEGLLGSDYLAHFPIVPITNISTNINMDEIPLLYDFRDIVPFGAEHSSLGSVVNKVASQFGVEVSPDPAPEEVFFIRSDQFSFVKEGIPSVAIDAGYKAVDPNLDGKKISDNFEQTRYHQPSDDMNQPLNFDAAAKYTRIVLCVGYEVAQAENPPHWNAGDFFLRFVH
jgi:Zn-dependent M28 family amino/carboxypeptidase